MPTPGGSRTAVIVDSVPVTRVGLARVAHLAGVRVVGDTADLDEGLAWAATVDLLVLGEVAGDVTAAVRRAKDRDAPPAAAVVVGNPTGEELRGLLAAGADALLARSIDVDDLLDTFRRVLGGERVVSPNLMATLVGMGAAPSTTAPAGDDANAEVVLTAKEREVLARLAHGGSNDEIATALYVSAATVKTHLSHIYGKLGARSRHEAVARALALGLLG